MAANVSSVTPDTLITIKVSLNDAVKKLKLPLKDLSATVLPDKLRTCLNIDAEQSVVFERYSDSAGGFITLNPANTAVFKALVRAAKAKGKLRLKASIIPPENTQEMETQDAVKAVPQHMIASDRQRIGSGIFHFREARASQQTLVNDEAPVPQPFSHAAAPQQLAFRTRGPAVAANSTSMAWSVYCNVCDVAMHDAHYHCSICDGGDYDLCEKCVLDGKTCPGEDHWLIKRFLKNGKVVASTTERVNRKASEPENKVPGAFTEETKTLTPEHTAEATRTCNNCVVVMSERDFVTCEDCEDFDLCIPCHNKNTHGHHPAHTLQPATVDTVLSASSKMLLQPGRNVEHNAFCDGCDKKIIGVRHKCLQCPDWDYCNACIERAAATHPRHRFAALYTQLADPQPNYVRHFGIYCDGPLCGKNARQSYIQGVRYKCAVCHDFDLCATCEALPNNHHNLTHPMIKFTTPVRNVNITTVNEDARGNIRNMGDKRMQPVKAEPHTIPVQTVADIAPTEEKKSPQTLDGDGVCGRAPAVVPTALLNATFVRDSIADGTVVAPGSRFTQIWTLRNEGPFAWPAGCSVRYVGGDNMLNVENGHPAPISLINEAIESSVVAREVQPGEEVAFRITLKAPMREGKSISYWRLKAVDGTPFGHRLWCDIDVRSTKPVLPPQLAVQAIPTHVDEARLDQSRVMAIRQQQLRLLHQQQMLRHMNANQDRQAAATELANARKDTAKARMEAIRARILQSRADNLKTYSALQGMSGNNGFTVKPKAEPQQETKPAVRPFVERLATRSIGDENTTFAKPETEIKAEPQLVVKSEPEVEIKTESKIEAEVKPKIESENEPKAAAEPRQDEELTNSASSSQMIFPKLEKESPASSMIASFKGKAAYVENEDGQVEQSAIPRSPSTIAEAQAAEDFDDLEVLSNSDLSDSDDGFLTDEEYDILDASDRETVASP